MTYRTRSARVSALVRSGTALPGALVRDPATRADQGSGRPRDPAPKRSARETWSDLVLRSWIGLFSGRSADPEKVGRKEKTKPVAIRDH